MSSLPFISHHLFVEAVGNDSHTQEEPRRRQKRPADLIDCSGPIPLELLEGANPVPDSVVRPSRPRATQVGA
jgi:hypothetical protein